MHYRNYPEDWIAELGEHYAQHVNALTAEKLHSKSEIALELAYRDNRIAELEAENARQREMYQRLEAEWDSQQGEIAALRERPQSITMTGAQLQDAYEYCVPDFDDPSHLETEVTIWRFDGADKRDGENISEPGLYCYFVDCPEEGSYGPLGKPLPTAEQEKQQ